MDLAATEDDPTTPTTVDPPATLRRPIRVRLVVPEPSKRRNTAAGQAYQHELKKERYQSAVRAFDRHLEAIRALESTNPSAFSSYQAFSPTEAAYDRLYDAHVLTASAAKALLLLVPSAELDSRLLEYNNVLSTQVEHLRHFFEYVQPLKDSVMPLPRSPPNAGTLPDPPAPDNSSEGSTTPASTDVDSASNPTPPSMSDAAVSDSNTAFIPPGSSTTSSDAALGSTEDSLQLPTGSESDLARSSDSIQTVVPNGPPAGPSGTQRNTNPPLAKPNATKDARRPRSTTGSLGKLSLRSKIRHRIGKGQTRSQGTSLTRSSGSLDLHPTTLALLEEQEQKLRVQGLRQAQAKEEEARQARAARELVEAETELKVCEMRRKIIQREALEQDLGSDSDDDIENYSPPLLRRHLNNNNNPNLPISTSAPTDINSQVLVTASTTSAPISTVSTTNIYTSAASGPAIPPPCITTGVAFNIGAPSFVPSFPRATTYTTTTTTSSWGNTNTYSNLSQSNRMMVPNPTFNSQAPAVHPSYPLSTQPYIPSMQSSYVPPAQPFPQPYIPPACAPAAAPNTIMNNVDANYFQFLQALVFRPADGALFDGKPENFLSFISFFENSIGLAITNPTLKLKALLDSLAPAIRTRLSHNSLLEPTLGYNRAVHMLWEDYGSPAQVYDAVLSTLEKGGSIDKDNLVAQRQLSRDVAGAQAVLQALTVRCNGLYDYESQACNKRLIA